MAEKTKTDVIQDRRRYSPDRDKETKKKKKKHRIHFYTDFMSTPVRWRSFKSDACRIEDTLDWTAKTFNYILQQFY